ncbi:Ubiquitin carboxyl-terminal hydrolase 2 [Acorus calamus]|uniref:Ubiquitin carboxyl-terminal hydrolase n=1 Tax=Acorus calamus TaxID=4465 RepID=A0AAV9C0H2_ACOCL|nr:Ubiquitin carboxyl-terminal hydrolase 2 [Acorus calamus]
MAKKTKSKARNPRKPHKSPSVPSPSDPPTQMTPDAAAPTDAAASCAHYVTGDAYVRVARRIADLDRCDDCPDDDPGRRPHKGKTKAGKKKKSAALHQPKIIWVCTSCGHAACGGVSAAEGPPHGHARRHSKQARHACAVRSDVDDDRLVCFCFECGSTVPLPPTPLGPAPVEDVVDGDAKGRVVRGLANLGNTCFFNSVVQNVLSLDALRGHFGALDRPVGDLTASLKKLFEETGLGRGDSNNALKPGGVFGCVCSRAPQFRGFQQQDSHELLMCLLDCLGVEERNSRGASSVAKTWVDLVFGGEVLTTVQCLECGHSSTVSEPFLDLSLPMPGKKTLPKRAMVVALPKKAKMGARKGRQRGSVNGDSFGVGKAGSDSTFAKMEDVNTQTEGGDSSCVVDGGAPMALPEVKDEDFWWMDWIDSVQMGVGVDEVDVTVSQCSENRQIIQKESSEEGNSAMNVSSMEDPIRKNVALDDLPTKDHVEGCSSVIGCEQAEVSMGNDSMLTEDCIEGSSAVSVCQQAEVEDYEGLGDLFNEPDATSEFKVETMEANEEREAGLSAGSSHSEFMQEEVDNMYSPVSIESCLAIFTKMEILSEEQKWHCESCSKSLQCQQIPTLERGDQSKVPKSCCTEGEIGDEEHNDDTRFDDLGDGGMGNDNLTSHVEGVDHETSSYVGGLENKRVTLESNVHELNNEVDSMVEDTSKSESNKQQSLCFVSLDKTSSHVVVAPGSSTDPDETVSIAKNTTLESQKVPQKVSKLPHKVHESEEERDKEHMKVMRDATLRVLIKKAPPVLIIHLKRFSNDGRRLNKLSGHVMFRELLDLRPYMCPSGEERGSCIYRLMGVVEHSGTMRGGHYVAYVRGDKIKKKGETVRVSSTWFYASDSHVREVSLAEVLKAEAYILFFERIHN